MLKRTVSFQVNHPHQGLSSTAKYIFPLVDIMCNALRLVSSTDYITRISFAHKQISSVSKYIDIPPCVSDMPKLTLSRHISRQYYLLPRGWLKSAQDTSSVRTLESASLRWRHCPTSSVKWKTNTAKVSVTVMATD